MTKDTQDFILALKQNKNKRDSLREIAIDYLVAWSACSRETYEIEGYLLDAVKMFFFDYAETAEHPAYLWRRYFEIKERHRNLREYYTDTDIFLTILDMARVIGDDGKFVNGFNNIDEPPAQTTTIDEAIEHCYEIVLSADEKICAECKADHLRLCGWLGELKRRREDEKKGEIKC